MKKILGLLSLLTIVTPLTTSSLNTKYDAINKKESTYDTAKFTDLGQVGKLVKMSETTGILGGSAFFDSTKVNETSHGIINLGIVGTFVRMSDTTGIFRERNTEEAYFFDSTKVNETNKGLIDLEIKIKHWANEHIIPIYRWSDTKLIFEDQGQEFYYFDSTKINEPRKGLIDLKTGSSFVRLSDTTALFIDYYFDQTYYIDNTMINDPDRGFIALEQTASFLYRLSDTTGFLIGFENETTYFFDSTKINDPNKGLIKLNQRGSSFARMSDTTGFLTWNNYGNNGLYWLTYFFDSTKINDENNGFINLEKTIFAITALPFYTPLTNTTGFFIENFERNGYPVFQPYLFDSTKINGESKGFTILEKEGSFFKLSATTAIFTEVIEWNYGKSYFFDSAKINDPNKGFVKLENNVTDFVSLTDTTGIAANENTTYYFEYN